MKKIKIFNGRLYGNGKMHHGYVGAYSVKHVVELCQQAGYSNVTIGEINVYWSKGCWGNPMAGIEPQVGVWVQEDRFQSPVKRLI